MQVSDAIESFLFHCRYEKNLSPHTLKAYTIDLNQFSQHLQGQGSCESIEAVDKVALRAYLKELFRGDKKEKTIKRKVATLRAFFNFLEREDTILVNPLRKMDVRIREPKRLPRTISLADIKRLFQHLYTEKAALSNRGSSAYQALVRDIAFLELLFATGARVSELCKLPTSELDLRRGRVRIFGKGSRERVVQLCNKEVLAALAEHHRFSSLLPTSPYFFCNGRGHRLAEQSVRAMLRKHASRSGVTLPLTPHMFRHSLATLLLEEGVDIRHIQHLLGHSSILTTQIYTQVQDHQQRRWLAAKHPRQQFHLPVSKCNYSA